MTSRARVVILNFPHHITQRGNKRERIFFKEGDQQVYLNLMAEQLARHDIACWSYCLMPNQMHFLLPFLLPFSPQGRWRQTNVCF
jgi:putative transposase